MNGELVARFELSALADSLSGGLPLDLTFRSIGNANGTAAVSYRWDAGWSQRLRPNASDFIWETGDGRALDFAATGGAWEGPPGSYTRLENVSGKLEMRDRSGARRVFDPALGRALTDVFDAAGNRWSLTYDATGRRVDALTDPFGRVHTFGYDTAVQSWTNPFYAENQRPIVTSVTDPSGRTTRLSYDIPTGRLTSIRVPAGANGAEEETRFEYDAADRIVRIRDPTATAYVSFEYDSFGRTTAQRTAGAGNYTFQHAPGSVRVRDPAGDDVDWRFPVGGLPALRMSPTAKVEITRGLRSGDPANFTTLYSYNTQAELTTITYPAGNSVSFAYDESPSFFSRGNLLSETLLPGPVAGSPLQSTTQASITIRYTYDPVCNKPTTIVAPPGNDTSFTPPNGGASSAERYTTRITYNAQCLPVLVEHPRANPAGVPATGLSEAYANQSVVERFTYNARGQLLTYTDPAGVVEARTYHPEPSTPGKPAGYLATVTQDAGGLALTTSFEYTDFGVVNKVTLPNGNVRTFSIDQRGRPTEEVGPALGPGVPGIRTRYAWDANDNLVRVERETAPGSGAFATIEYAYDALDRLVSETRRPNATTALTTTYAYDGNGNLVRRTGPGGESTNWTYDERDLLLSQSGPDGGTFAYDANGNLRQHTDPLGRVTTFRHDGFDRLIEVTDAHQSRFVTSYDPSGNVVAERGIGGTSARLLYDRTFAHDELGRAYQTREWLQDAETATPSGVGPGSGVWVTTLREFDPRGLVTRALDAEGRALASTYDAAGRLASVVTPDGTRADHAYDANGNLLSTTRTLPGAAGAVCPDVCTTSFAYDAEDRLVRTTNPDGTTRTLGYDGRGNVIRTTDETGTLVLHEYDLADRPTVTLRRIQESPADFVTTSTVWDAEGRVAEICDDAVACTSRTYVAGTTLVATETPPTGPSVTNTYDAAGNLVRAAYSSGKAVRLTYDALDRLTNVEVEGTPGLGTSRQQFVYDDLGRVTQAIDNGVGNLGAGIITSLGQITATQRYDTLGRVTSETQLGLPVTHTYDASGRVLTTMYPSWDGRLVSRSYDEGGRLDRLWDTKGLLAEYEHAGPLVVRKDFGGPLPSPPALGPSSPVLRTSVAFDAAERPFVIHHAKPGAAPLVSLHTRFDAAGNRAAQQLVGPAGVGSDAYSQLYELDALRRTRAWAQGPISGGLDAIPTPTAAASWPDIDGQNDWVAWTSDSAACTRTTGVSVATATREVRDVCSGQPSVTYAYDADGNLASDGTFRYRWDFLNRLVRVEEPDGDLVVGYGYDAFGRRVVKVFPDNELSPAAGVQGRRESWYTYAGHHVLQESQPIGSILPNGLDPTRPNVHIIRQWVYGPSVDEALVMDVDADQSGISAIDPADRRYFYAYDSGANVLGLVDEAGHMVEGYAYQPYGAPTVLVPASGAQSVRWDGTDVVSTGVYGADPTQRPFSPSGNLWFFTGRQYDPEIGSYHYRARQYHPGLGQFMSLDPLGAWSDPTSLGNPYAYVGNNPGSWRDPSGLVVETVWDVANIGLGVYSLQQNVREGNWWWAAVDVGGIAVDVVAAATPVVPGGAGSAIKGARVADNAVDGVQATQRATDGALLLDEAGGLGKLEQRAPSNAAPSPSRTFEPDGRGSASAREVDFVVSPGGDVIPIPQGAKGPLPTINKQHKVTGFHFMGGEGRARA